MQRNGSRLFPIFIILVVVAIVVVAVISIGRAVFNSTQNNDSPQTPDNGRSALLNTSENHSVKLTVRGPIVAQENFASYTVAVSPSSRNMTVYKGYLDSVQKNKQLSNNKKAYEQFVYALDKANMMKGTVPSDDAKNDLRGICATGYVYEYSVLSDDQSVKRLWTSTCDGSKGSLDASTNQLNELFLAQLPGSKDLIPFRTSGLDLLTL